MLLCPSLREELKLQSLRQVELLHDRWRHHLSPPLQVRHGNNLHSPAPVVSPATARKTFGPTDLTSTYSVSTRRHRNPATRNGDRCSNH
ncbi:hypothetical protein TNCV_912791 [Trichonephila clavipes]|nr:hypothetical protein TNCV_912791 [Trichonephila clavipes]